MAAEMSQKSSRSRRFLSGIALLLLSTLLSLCAVELFVRQFWENQPESIFPNDTGCCAASSLRPGVTGHDFFHRFRHNSRGYRGPEYPREHPGKTRVAIVGDSFVYGVGVSEEDAIPGVLQERVRRSSPDVEVINAGVPGANLEWDMLRVRAVARDYRPDVVVMVMLYNDLELNTGTSNVAPQIETMRVTTEAKKGWLGRLSELMLPRVQQGDPRFGPGSTPPRSVALKYAIARYWRTYLYVALELGRVGTTWKQIDRQLTLLHVESRQNDEVIWGRLKQSLTELQGIAQKEGFRFGLVLFQEGPLEGVPTLKLRDTFQAAGLTWLDLAPLWGSFDNFNRKYSFRFDGHPNRKANRMAAEAIDNWLADLGWLPAPATAEQKQWMASYHTRMADYRAGQEKIAAGQRKELEARRASFSPTLEGDEESDAVRAAQADQWLYGWYRSGNGVVGGGPRGRYMGRSGGFFLRAGKDGAHSLRVEGARLAGGDTPAISLQAVCNGASLGAPQTPVGPTFVLNFPFDAPAEAGAVLECELTASGSVGANSPRGPNSPPSEASFAITRLALEAEGLGKHVQP